MTTATLPRKRTRKPTTHELGIASNGILMSPEEFDRAEFSDLWNYELINGVLVVSPLVSLKEADPNEELGFMLRLYHETHHDGEALDFTIAERIVKTRANRRRADRLIWAGLRRLPRRDDIPTVIVEFVSGRKRDRERDYETKREEYQAIRVQEYWIIDRFTKTMTSHILEGDKYRKKPVTAKQVYRTKLLPGFELRLARLFELADRWSDEKQEDTP